VIAGREQPLTRLAQVWIDVLLSAGVPVEVCKVKAKEASDAAMVKLEKQAKRKASTLASASLSVRRSSVSLSVSAGGRDAGGAGKVGEYLYASEEEIVIVEDGDEAEEREGDEDGGEDEWINESGEEGKAEGYWERGGKRVKVGS
jgi:Fanconi-associated nuclease 1